MRAPDSLVGDSLTEQHHQIIRNILHSSSGPFEFRSYGSRPRVDAIFLNPNHNRTKHYLKLAGVTEERLGNPITTFVLERHLLSLAEFDQAFAHLDGYLPLSSENGPHQWISESTWDGEYRKLLEKPVVFEEAAGIDVAEESTILVLSTGPHWIAREVSNSGVSDQDLLQGYNNMVSPPERASNARDTDSSNPGRCSIPKPDSRALLYGQDMVPRLHAWAYERKFSRRTCRIISQLTRLHQVQGYPRTCCRKPELEYLPGSDRL